MTAASARRTKVRIWVSVQCILRFGISMACNSWRSLGPESDIEEKGDAMKRNAEQALLVAKELAKNAKSAVDFHNAFFGIGGKFGELFPTRAEREAFLKTPEYREIFRMRAELRDSEKAAS
jgi:hypothetical protein